MVAMSLEKQASWNRQTAESAERAVGCEAPRHDAAAAARGVAGVEATPPTALQDVAAPKSISDTNDAATEATTLEGVLDNLGVDDLIARLQAGRAAGAALRSTTLPPAYALWSDDEPEHSASPEHSAPDSPSTSLRAGPAAPLQRARPGAEAAADACMRRIPLQCRAGRGPGRGSHRVHAWAGARGQHGTAGASTDGVESAASSSEAEDEVVPVSAYRAQRRAMKAGTL